MAACSSLDHMRFEEKQNILEENLRKLEDLTNITFSDAIFELTPDGADLRVSTDLKEDDFWQQFGKQIALAKLSVKHYTIGFIGERGAGKTTLLNRVLGFSLFPTAFDESMTAAIGEVIGWERTDFVLQVHFRPLDDWIAFVLSPGWDSVYQRGQSDPEISPEEQALNAQLITMTGKGIQDFPEIGEKPSDESDLRAWTESHLPSDLLQFIHSHFSIWTFEKIEDLSGRVWYFSAATARFWPFVDKIEIFGFFPRLLGGGFRLLDIPGFGDSRPDLFQRYEAARELCDYLIFLPPSKRVFTQSTIDSLRETEILMRATQETPALSIVMTHFHSLRTDNKLHPSNPNRVLSPERVKEKWFTTLDLEPISDIRSALASIPVFFVENEAANDPTFSNLYDELFEKFLAECLQGKSLGGMLQAQSRWEDAIADAIASLRTRITTLSDEDRRTLSTLSALSSPASLPEYPSEFSDTAKLASNFVLSFVPACPQERWTFRPKNRHHTQLKKVYSNFGQPYLDIDIFDSLSTAYLSYSQSTSFFSAIRQQLSVLGGLFASWFQFPDLGDNESLQDLVKLIRDKAVRSIKSIKLLSRRDLVSTIHNTLKNPVMQIFKSRDMTKLIHGEGCESKMLSALQSFLTPDRATAFLDLIQQRLIDFLKTHLDQIQSRWHQICQQSICYLKDKLEILPTTEALKRLETVTLILRNPFIHHSSIPESRELLLDDQEEQIEDMTHRIQTVDLTQHSPQKDPYASPVVLSQPTHLTLHNLHLLAPGALVSISGMRFSTRIRQTGYLYVLSNVSFMDKHLFKIGYTTVAVSTRAQVLASTGVPQPFKIEVYWKTENARIAETLFHKLLSKQRPNKKREFFSFPLELIKLAGPVIVNHVNSHFRTTTR